MFLDRGLHQWSLWPQVRSQVRVGHLDRFDGCLREVSKSAGRSSRRCVTVFDSCHCQQLLRNMCSDNSCSTGSRNQSDQDGSTLAGDLKKYKKNIKNRLFFVVFVLGMVLTRSRQLPADHMVIEYTLLSPSTDHEGQEVSHSSSTQSPTHLTVKRCGITDSTVKGIKSFDDSRHFNVVHSRNETN